MDELEKSTFIKVDKFDTVISAMAVIKRKLNDARNTLDKINSLKQEEDSAVEKWAGDLSAVEEKIANIEMQLTREQE